MRSLEVARSRRVWDCIDPITDKRFAPDSASSNIDQDLLDDFVWKIREAGTSRTADQETT